MCNICDRAKSGVKILIKEQSDMLHLIAGVLDGDRHGAVVCGYLVANKDYLIDLILGTELVERDLDVETEWERRKDED
jgi:hypothetical protein